MSDKYKQIGEILSAARRQQNKSLKIVSESTKIMVHFLEALEAGEPDKLPSPAYFTLFARNYAQHLGIDSALLDEIEEKNATFANSAGSPAAPVKAEADEKEVASRVQTRKFVRTLVYLVITIIVIFIAFVLYNQFFIVTDHGPVRNETVVMPSDETPSAAGEPGDRTELIIPDQPYISPDKLRLHMVVKQEVWAMVVRDGDTILNRRLDPGEERYWEAEYRYSLTLGISTAVDLFVNDQKLAPLTDRARTVSGVEINQINYRDFLPVAEAPGDAEQPGSQPDQAADITDKESPDGD